MMAPKTGPVVLSPRPPKSQKLRLKSDCDATCLSRFRSQPPKAFAEIYSRATTQRFYVLSRTRGGTSDCPSEEVEMTGSTGNIYTVTIDREPTCSCPMGAQRQHCKHIVYVMARVLRAKFEHVYQLALLSDELREIFARAPPIQDKDAEIGGGHGKRKEVDGDCPICFEEMKAGGGEALVWCRAACGQNVHKACFEMWAKTKRQGQATVTCPYCRSLWEEDNDMVKKIEKGNTNVEGYVNVADRLGISTRRDYSTYSTWWPGHPRHSHYGGRDC
ncbi:hypothetical protein B0T25DRAFT_32983 [Lasiosphaeria hispida]|uniref:Znf1 n=1 Tax=Lasiosphaeria hispida TaxID=260671 RepID=A0AAJ0MJX4_9PEZI|nr:hypothetical protein B0T25DRAFT_32983 [Lasiosphaeria hispida]